MSLPLSTPSKLLGQVERTNLNLFWIYSNSEIHFRWTRPNFGLRKFEFQTVEPAGQISNKVESKKIHLAFEIADQELLPYQLENFWTICDSPAKFRRKSFGIQLEVRMQSLTAEVSAWKSADTNLLHVFAYIDLKLFDVLPVSLRSFKRETLLVSARNKLSNRLSTLNFAGPTRWKKLWFAKLCV